MKKNYDEIWNELKEKKKETIGNLVAGDDHKIGNIMLSFGETKGFILMKEQIKEELDFEYIYVKIKNGEPQVQRDFNESENNNTEFDNYIIVESSYKDEEIHLKNILNTITKNNLDHYNFEHLKVALQEVADQFYRKYPPKKEEIIGLWGELFFLNNLLKRINSIKYKTFYTIINSWEKSGHYSGRSAIDFKFNNLLACEIKTTTQKERKHHIQSLNQLDYNKNFKFGFLISYMITDSNKVNSKSCVDLIKSIKEILQKDPTSLEIFNEKIDFLHPKVKLSKDKYSVLGGEKIYPFEGIPKPKIDSAIEDVSWLINLNKVNCINNNNFNEIFDEYVSL